MSADFVLGGVFGFATAVLIGVAAFVVIAAIHFNPPTKEDQ